ncbi:hypothetical protein [Streptomyces sp. NPDC087294]|uniref:hypothetical protein n=1 Tax=Streptomyces sp. NPDC087294 TaxID=3365777 RepID=UPI00380A22B5
MRRIVTAMIALGIGIAASMVSIADAAASPATIWPKECVDGGGRPDTTRGPEYYCRGGIYDGKEIWHDVTQEDCRDGGGKLQPTHGSWLCIGGIYNGLTIWNPPRSASSALSDRIGEAT